jgi:hypothetical protein
LIYEWTKKIHIWAGLLTFTAFVVWGITGIYAIFLPAPGQHQPPEISAETEFPFEAPGDLDDKQLAKRIFAAAELKMAGGHYNVHRDENQHLKFFVFTANGRRDVTYLEERKRVRVEFRRNNLGGFLSTMHTGHSRRGAPDLSARLWGYYNELSTWALLFMSLSGLYMWIATRPGLPWARICIGGAAVVSVILWVAVR